MKREQNNIKVGVPHWVSMLRSKANETRTALFFALRCRWAKRNGMIRIPWSVSLWSPHKDISFGSHVQLGPGTIIHCDAIIGNKVLIARNVAFINRDDHRYDIIGKTIWDSPRGDKFKVIVEDDVWIGHGAIIISGVKIGRGSVVAAGSVVNKDIPPYSIVAGVPARVLKHRFSEAEIIKHESLLGL